MAIAFVAGYSAGIGLPAVIGPVNTTGPTNLIIICANGYSGFATIADSAGNTWTQIGVGFSGGTSFGTAWYCLNPTLSATHTFTANQLAAQGVALSVALFSGVSTTAALDQGTQTNTSLSSGSITPTQANELVIACSASELGSGGCTPSGYTAGASKYNTSISSVIAYQIQTTATATNPTWNTGCNGTSANSGTLVASFFAAPASITLMAGTGSFVFTGNNTQENVSIPLNAGTGAFTFTGNSVNFTTEIPQQGYPEASDFRSSPSTGPIKALFEIGTSSNIVSLSGTDGT